MSHVNYDKTFWTVYGIVKIMAVFDFYNVKLLY